MPDRNASTHRRRIVARITKAAGQWACFARSAGCTFDVEGKAASAVAFCLAAGGSSFAIPSKLIGTTRHQRDLASLALSTGWSRLDIDLDEHERLTAYWHHRPIGRTQPKHDAWLLYQSGPCPGTLRTYPPHSRYPYVDPFLPTR